MNTPTITKRDEIPGLVPGKWALLATLAISLVVFAAVFVSVALWEKPGPAEEPGPVWAQRGDWRMMPAKPTMLQPEPGHKPPFESRRRKDLDFVISPEDAKLIHELSLAAWALQIDDFDPGAVTHIERIATEHPGMFYPTMLLALIQRQRGDDAAAEKLFSEAFAAAPGAIRLQYVDDAGEPVAGLALGAIEIVCAQMSDGNLDESCRLVYPYLVTDSDGWVYLPVYETVYRASELPQPPGKTIDYRMPGWFEFPGRLGEMPAAVVRPE